DDSVTDGVGVGLTLRVPDGQGHLVSSGSRELVREAGGSGQNFAVDAPLAVSDAAAAVSTIEGDGLGRHQRSTSVVDRDDGLQRDILAAVQEVARPEGEEQRQDELD